MAVTLVEKYNPQWPVWFDQLKARFESVLTGMPHSIEHVGSTSIAGMTAKPVIDIDIVIEPGTFATVSEQLAGAGYFHQGDLGLSGREAFDLTDEVMKGRVPPHHMYVCDRGNIHLIRHHAFREFLRLHPVWADRLSDLKWSLCQQRDNNRKAYVDGKSALCEEITELGLKYFRQSDRVLSNSAV